MNYWFGIILFHYHLWILEGTVVGAFAFTPGVQGSNPETASPSGVRSRTYGIEFSPEPIIIRELLWCWGLLFFFFNYLWILKHFLGMIKVCVQHSDHLS